MESEYVSMNRERAEADFITERHSAAPARSMGVADSIKYRFLEKQWEEERWAFISLAHHVEKAVQSLGHQIDSPRFGGNG